MPATAEQVFAVIKNNGAVPFRQQPTEKALRYYAALIVKSGARFAADQHARDAWTGITNWALSKNIARLEAEIARKGAQA
jgi:hypothetical protein